MLTVAHVLKVLESQAPLGTAEAWDNVGLLVGNAKHRVTKVGVAVDLSAKALQLAKARKIQLLITHHPCIFPKSKGISRVTAGDKNPKTALIFDAIESGIAIAAYHTNFDRCALEVPQAISKGLGLVPRGRLIEKPTGSLVKLCVYVPVSHVEQVRTALAASGAGEIGNYDFCTFGVTGEGTFRGSASARPFLGKPGRMERAAEVRLETILPRGMEAAVLKGMRDAHPYEEIAYDLYPVEQRPSAHGLVRGLGYGFWGEFEHAKPFSDVARSVRRLFQVDGFLMTDPAPKKVKRVAFAAGKGASVVNAAAELGCDLMITGEAGYHESLEASSRLQSPMGVLELGHRESEAFFVPTVKSWLTRAGISAVGFEVKTQKFRTV